MKGENYLQYLTKDELDKFKSNFLLYRTNREWYEYIECEFSNFINFIALAFGWSNSVEGYSYWSSIATSNRQAIVKYKMDKFKFV